MAVNQSSPPSRRTMQRSKSIDKTVRGFIGRSLSFNMPRSNFARQSPHNSFSDVSYGTTDDDTALNIFASDMVSSEHILDKLKHVKHNRQIVVLEIEDFITSGHHSLLPVVKALLSAQDRVWKSIQFVDSITAEDYLWWQGLQLMVLQEYHTNESSHDIVKMIKMQAQMMVPSMTPAEDVKEILATLLHDNHKIKNLYFSGALFGYGVTSIPTVLAKLLKMGKNGEGNLSLCLEKEITIHVDYCGPEDTPEADWQKLCRKCIQVLKSGKTPTAEASSSSSSSSSSSCRHARCDHDRKDDGSTKRPSMRRNATAPDSLRRSISAAPYQERHEQQPQQKPSSNASCDGQAPASSEIVSQSMNKDTPLRQPMRCSENDGKRNSGKKLSRELPRRTKSLNVTSKRATAAAERLALLGANGSSLSRQMAGPLARVLEQSNSSSTSSGRTSRSHHDRSNLTKKKVKRSVSESSNSGETQTTTGTDLSFSTSSSMSPSSPSSHRRTTRNVSTSPLAIDRHSPGGLSPAMRTRTKSVSATATADTMSFQQSKDRPDYNWASHPGDSSSRSPTPPSPPRNVTSHAA